MRVWPGSPSPLGATWDGEGTNFAVFSEHATAVDLCLFDHREDAAGIRAHPAPRAHRPDLARLPAGRAAGQLYGFRVHGPYAPEEGHRFNPAKLLLDPYAKAISGTIRWSDALSGYSMDRPIEERDLVPDGTDSAGGLPKCVVVESAFSWGDDKHPRTPWNRTVIYEAHVKGMTMLHPDVPEAIRGTYLGLATDPIIDHLLSLGVTAIELLPVHHFVDRASARRDGAGQLLGVQPPSATSRPTSATRPAALGQQVAEFKSMVKRFHRAGIEVILDVVYNHTAEGNHLGPTLCFRGIDNSAYYRLEPEPAVLHRLDRHREHAWTSGTRGPCSW